MNLNPLNELKRRLEDDTTPLPKRLCLAKNIVTSHHFPMASKEHIIGDWLGSLTRENKLTGAEFQRVLEWSTLHDLTEELKSTLVGVVSQYVQKNILQKNDVKIIISFLENPTMTAQLCQQTDDSLTITVTLLRFLKNDENNNIIYCERLLNNVLRLYKDSKKKLEFIIKFLEGESLESVFSFLYTQCRNTVIEVCQNILFPIYKKTFFISYLQTLIRKDNIEELILEKGDNIQSVLKIMNIFFNFPEHRVEGGAKFLENFIDVFVSCFRKENQIIFAFYIMVANFLNMKQEYIVPSIDMKSITFEENDEKIKRNLFLKMLQIILKNEIDITVRLTDTFGEKIPKVETKKTFMTFLQIVLMGQIKFLGKIDKTTLEIIITALKLDPALVEQRMEEILPLIMTSKKSPNNADLYKTMLNCLLEILFKLSRGTQFLTQMLPLLKFYLETSNTEQLKIAQEIKVNDRNGFDTEKLRNKLISGCDIFPIECSEMFGKLTMDLMFRQNKELLESLQKDLEDHCLLLLEEGFVSPSTVTLTEVLSSVISSFLRHSKMSDHTVPQHIAEEFWSSFSKFEECLKRFGLCVLKVTNQSLLHSYLTVCLSFAQLKLLNMKYSNCKMHVPAVMSDDQLDLSVLLPCLSKEEWRQIAGMVDNEGAMMMMDKLLLLKTMVIQLQSSNEEQSDYTLDDIKSHLIKQLNSNPGILKNETFLRRVLFSDLNKNQYKQLARALVKLYMNDEATEKFNDVAVVNNRLLLNALVLEVAKNVTKCLGNCDSLTKALSKTDLDIAAFAKEANINCSFNEISLIENDDVKLKKCIEILKSLWIPYLDENYQLTAIFVLLAAKKCCQAKKVRKSIDYLLQNIFELSLYVPDLYKIFPVNSIFSFKNTTLIDLLTLNIKTSNQLLVIKCLVEKAVKRVKTDSDLVKTLVQLLISKKLHKNKSIEAFSDPAFQISCLVLPLILKQKKAITASVHRSILADLQEKLHQTLLETFKNIDFSENGGLFIKTDNIENSTKLIDSESNVAALNAISAYTLTLSKYCETTDAREIQNLDCLWSGLEFFIQNAIQSISNPCSKPHHIESSIHLLNITLRHIKKLGTHPIFQEKDKLFIQIWNAVTSRLLKEFQIEGSVRKCMFLEEIGVTLRFVCALVSLEGFARFVGDLGKLVVLKKPLEIIKDPTKSHLTNHKVSKFIWTQCLKAKILGVKCNLLTRLMYQNSRNLKAWIRQHFDSVHSVASHNKKRKLEIYGEEREVKIVKVHDDVCDILRVELDTLSEVIFTGKMMLDYKFLDSVYELQHMVHYILGSNGVHLKCKVTGQSYFKLFEGSVAVLNSMLMAREELLEDRWPCFMQCYRTLVATLCENRTIQDQLDKGVQDRIGEAAHSIEKLTQAISKRKKQVSRIAAYTVADLCTALEKNAPPRNIRQHLENSIASLMQASDSTYAMAFLKRALAGSVGQMTMTNLYMVYKRYHKYTGNS